MKKQLIAIGLASVLTAPSVALAQEEEAAAAEEVAVEEMVTEEMAAEAPAGPSVTIYGSLRTGLEFKSGGGASDATVKNFGSRVGLRGSTEVSEGLTASFQLEHTFNTATASLLGGGNVGMVGLSGGFGTLAFGKLATASDKHYGDPTNPTQSYGDFGGNTGKQANMVSYSSSVGALGFQIDRSTDANGVATVQFGASAAAGPVNVGFAYWGKEDSKTTATTYTTTTTYENVSYTEADGTAGAGGDLTVTDKDGTVTATLTAKPVTVDNDVAPDLGKVVTGGTVTDTATALAAKAKKSEATYETKTTPNPKTSFTGFFVSSSLAGMNLALGVGSTDHGVKDTKIKVGDDGVDESQTDVSIVALTGAVGDSGVSYAVRMHDSDDVKNATTGVVSDPSHTVVNLTSVLGGGASLVFETVSYKDADDASLIALKIDF